MRRFNPKRSAGQGMSVAVLEAVALGKQMGSNLPARAGAASAAAAAAPDAAWLSSARRALPSATRVFMRGVGSILEVPWALATGSDAPFVPGFKRGPVETIINDVFVEVGGAGACTWGAASAPAWTFACSWVLLRCLWQLAPVLLASSHHPCPHHTSSIPPPHQVGKLSQRDAEVHAQLMR